MTHGFQQQDTSSGFCIPKSVAMPQHGQKADGEKAQPRARRAPSNPDRGNSRAPTAAQKPARTGTPGASLTHRYS